MRGYNKLKYTLNDIFEFIRNGASIKQFDGSGTPITRIETIADGTVNLDKVGYADIFDSKYEDYYLKENDILMSHINSLKHLGKVAIVKQIESSLIHGMNLLCLRPKNIVDPKFMFNFFRSNYFMINIMRISKKSVNQASFTLTDLKKIEVDIPSLGIQKQIADILDLAYEIIETRKEQLAEMDKLLQSLFIQQFGDPLTNEKGWKLSDIANVTVDMKYGTSAKSIITRESLSDIPIIRIPNVKRNYIDYTTLSYLPKNEIPENIILKPGDLLFVRSNGNPEYIGRVATFEDSECDIAYASYLIRLRIDQSIIKPQFLSFMLSTDKFRRYISSYGSTTAGNYNINTQNLKKIKIIIPPINNQIQFLELLSEITNSKKVMEESLQEMENNFNVLMQKAFRGELFPE